MVGCQKSKCPSSWPPITTFTCIVNIQTSYVVLNIRQIVEQDAGPWESETLA